MTFETEYQLEQFRKVQSEYFDENNKPYASISANDQNILEQMLKLIDQMELEIIELEDKLENEQNRELFIE